MIGTSISEKRIRFPGKYRSNRRARAKPSISSIIVAVSAKIKVKRIELQKFGSERRLL
jgi:hypothetical protein